LHREALKQSAVDPATGRVDINILAAGMSSTTRKTVHELAEVIKEKMKLMPGTSFPIKKLLFELRQNSDRVSHNPVILSSYSI
jgi:DNA replication licensing factor MCM4